MSLHLLDPVRRDAWSPLRPHERAVFDRDGFVVVRRVLGAHLLQRVRTAVQRLHGAERDRAAADGSLHLQGILDRDPAFLDLLDLPATFRFAWGLLGWNIYSHHNHVDVHPPLVGAGPLGWNWHQDGYRQNSDVDAEPRPMLSLKVGFALSDLTVPGSGATRVVPGSHRDNTLPGRPARAGEPGVEPAAARPVDLRPGDAVVFDRRLWHARARNVSDTVRSMVFLGYTYRWIRPLDETDYRRDRSWFAAQTPVRRQLLGGGENHANHWGIRPDGWVDEQIPLRRELAERGLLDGTTPYLR